MLCLSLSLSLQATGHLEGKYKHLTYKGHLTADDTVTELPSTHSAACDHGSKAHHGLKVNICVCFPKHVRTSTRISSHLSQQNSTSEVTGYLHKTDCIINSYFNLQYYFTQYYCSYCIFNQINAALVRIRYFFQLHILNTRTHARTHARTHTHTHTHTHTQTVS